MVKPKQRELMAIPPSTENSLLGEADSWVIVKKQRVTILVPSLPAAERSTIQDPGPTENNRLEFPTETLTVRPSAEEQGKSTLVTPGKGIRSVRKTPAERISTSAKQPRLELRVESEIQDQVGPLKYHKILGVLNSSKTIKRPRLFHGTSSYHDGSTLLNQRLRALNLERKLQKAGGLSRWLASLGLGQFVRIFEGKGVNKFQLVNLTMKKLKDMGADAVGPRRKLIHAIDCICQPYCFDAC